MSADEKWYLYYWPSLPGRGDFVRLMFEEMGVEYVDVGRVEGVQAVLQYYNGTAPGFPVYCPPIVRRGDFVMNGTPAILQYLGKISGMYPDGAENEAHGWQINAIVTDLMGEGHDAYHPVKRTGSYDSQKEAAAPIIKQFQEERLPKYLGYLERVLKLNEKNEFFLGSKITYVDITVFHALRAAEFQFPDDYKSLPIPTLRAFKERMAARPHIAAFLASSRSIPFCGNSMM